MMRQLSLFPLVVAWAGLTASQAYSVPVDPRPNILYVITDDQRYDSIRAFNHIVRSEDASALGPVKSPHVDRLVSRGTTFINTYVHATGCAPSRASIHYGRYPHHSGVYQFEYHHNQASHFASTLPEAMRDLGYQTFHVGKLGVRLRTFANGQMRSHAMYDQDVKFQAMRADGLTDWSKGEVSEINGQPLPTKVHGDWFYTPGSGSSFDVTSGELNELAGFETHSQAIDQKYDLLRMYNSKKPKGYGRGEIIGGVSPKPAGQTRDGHYVTELDRFLSHPNAPLTVGRQTYRGVDPSRPLFAHLGFDFPHTPVLPPKSFRDQFAGYTYRVPEVDPAERDKLPPQLKKLVTQNASDHYTDKEKQQMVRDYFAFCAYGDQLVGEAADRFIAFSEAQKRPWTIVYVCGDHGWKLNEHGAISKFTPWNIDSQNPIVIVSSDTDRFPAGKVVTDFTEFVDIMPTVLAAGGADLRDPRFGFLDGYDLAQVAAGHRAPRDYVLGESHHVTGPRASIRTQAFMYSLKVRPHTRRGQDQDWTLKATDLELEPVLYDLANDPDELNNVAHEPAYAEVARIMKTKLIDIVIGDGRVEVDWTKPDTVYRFESFAPGADDKKISLP